MSEPTPPPPPKPCYKGLRVAVQWIPVTEVLPDDFELVLVTNDRAEVFISFVSGARWNGRQPSLTPVTHWAYLPAAPQRHQKEEA